MGRQKGAKSGYKTPLVVFGAQVTLWRLVVKTHDWGFRKGYDHDFHDWGLAGWTGG
jgi:hypothetical protein